MLLARSNTRSGGAAIVVRSRTTGITAISNGLQLSQAATKHKTSRTLSASGMDGLRGTTAAQRAASDRRQSQKKPKELRRAGARLGARAGEATAPRNDGSRSLQGSLHRE